MYVPLCSSPPISDGRSSLVTPWQKNGSIMEYLARSPNADRLVLVHQLALAIQHLHAQPKPLVHGAVQPSNILISDAGTVQLADFATAKVLESLADSAQNTMTSGSTSNLRWMAPELIEGQYGTPADVWGWAITSLQVRFMRRLRLEACQSDRCSDPHGPRSVLPDQASTECGHPSVQGSPTAATGLRHRAHPDSR